MTDHMLELLVKRIEALEKKMAEQTTLQPLSPTKDWRRSVGMYADREVAKQIEAEGRAIREEEREAAQHEDVE